MSFVPGVIASFPTSAPSSPPSSTLPRVSATHWRIYMPVTAGQGNFYIAGIEMRAAGGGPDQCSGGTPSAFSNTSTAASAFDDSAGTSWYSATGAGENGWIEYQFAAAVEVVEIVLAPTSSVLAGAPRHIVLQHADDGAAWETLASWLSLDWSDDFAKRLNGANASAALPAGTAIMWRLNVTANNGDSFFTEIAEMEFRAAVGGADQTNTSNAGPFGSSNASGVASAFDGTGAAGTPARFNSPVTGWIAYALQDPVAVVEVAITADSAAARAPKDFSLDYSNDGRTWTTAFSKTGQTGWASDETRAFAA